MKAMSDWFLLLFIRFIIIFIIIIFLLVFLLLLNFSFFFVYCDLLWWILFFVRSFLTVFLHLIFIFVRRYILFFHCYIIRIVWKVVILTLSWSFQLLINLKYTLFLLSNLSTFGCDTSLFSDFLQLILEIVELLKIFFLFGKLSSLIKSILLSVKHSCKPVEHIWKHGFFNFSFLLTTPAVRWIATSTSILCWLSLCNWVVTKACILILNIII